MVNHSIVVSQPNGQVLLPLAASPSHLGGKVKKKLLQYFIIKFRDGYAAAFHFSCSSVFSYSSLMIHFYLFEHFSHSPSLPPLLIFVFYASFCYIY